MEGPLEPPEHAEGFWDDADAELFDRHRASGDRRSFRRWLSVIVLAALALRVGYCFVIAGDEPAGDALWYAAVGQQIAAGHGFSDPFVGAQTVPVASHPPAAAVVLAIAPMFIDRESTFRGHQTALFGQRLTFALVGALTVAVIGLAARRVGGDRMGLIAAAIAAVTPELWINDGILMAESLAALSVAVVVLAAYRCADLPVIPRWIALGIACGAATLVRSEALLLGPLLIVPMAVVIYRRRLLTAVAAVAIGAVAMAGVGALWVVPNLVRYPEPVLYSTNDGLTLLGANCPETTTGGGAGTWSLSCLRLADADRNGRDDWADYQDPPPFGSVPPEASALSIEYRRVALRYIRTHLHDYPTVAAIRLGRLWGVYRPDQMVDYNQGEGRRPLLSWLAWGAHLVTTVTAAFGIVRLYRRKRPVVPLVAQAVAASLTGALIYGLARFRIGWDVAAVIAAAAALEWLWSRRDESSRRDEGSRRDSPAGEVPA